MKLEWAIQTTVRAIVWGVFGFIICTAAYASVWFWWYIFTA